MRDAKDLAKGKSSAFLYCQAKERGHFLPKESSSKQEPATGVRKGLPTKLKSVLRGRAVSPASPHSSPNLTDSHASLVRGAS